MRAAPLVLLLSLLLPAAPAGAPVTPARGEAEHRGVLLEFSASWCGPCQQMSPVVSRLQRQGYPIRKIDVDRQRELARRYRISSIPAFVLVVDGREVSRQVGVQSERTLKRLMAQIPKSEPQQKAPSNAFGRPQTRREPSPPQRGMAAGHRGDGSKQGGPAGFPIPLFGAKRETEQPAAVATPAADPPPIIRAKYDRDDRPARDAPRYDPLASSTRIRINDGRGYSFGSGTIIDSRPGRTIVLTCGHIFRSFGDESVVEVNVFHGERFEKYVGKVIDYDLEADVGLIEIPTESPLPVSRVAGADAGVDRNERVFSIGCGGGDPPTKQRLRVTALNRYLGPDNIECTGVPEQGRSGGGLFNDQGQVIGVCIAADPKEQRGLYAGLKAIQSLLDRAELSRLYRSEAAVAAVQEPDAGGHSAPEIDVADQPAASRDEVPLADNRRGDTLPRNQEPEASAGELQPGSPRARLAAANAGAAEADAAALGDLEDAEVICIIRPLNEPRSASRVVIINRASSRFVSYLKGELRSQPRPTTVKRPAAVDEAVAGAEHDASTRQGTRFVRPQPPAEKINHAAPGHFPVTATGGLEKADRTAGSRNAGRSAGTDGEGNGNWRPVRTGRKKKQGMSETGRVVERYRRTVAGRPR